MTEKPRIDLRSDTVTKPTPEMRSAMAAAEVGDDVYREDPTVNRLQERAAQVFGKEAALFVPSGTMGNQIAIHLHTRPGQEVIAEQRAHIFDYELAAMASISGVLARPIATARGIMEWSQIEAAISPDIYYRAPTGLVALENTHNMAGGTLYTAEEIRFLCERIHARGLPVHLDGARIFNAAVALGTSVADLSAHCDSVMFCLSKGLAAPAGSILLGKREFIERALRVRKMLGGGMRQVGVLAAAGLIALEKMPGRLQEDHDHAALLAGLLNEIPGLVLDVIGTRTNIIVVDISHTGYDSLQLADMLKMKGVLVGIVDLRTLRLLTHLDVGRSQIEETARIFKSVLHQESDS